MEGEIQSVIFPVSFKCFSIKQSNSLRESWLSVGGVLCSAMLAIRAAYFPHSIHTNVQTLPKMQLLNTWDLEGVYTVCSAFKESHLKSALMKHFYFFIGPIIPCSWADQACKVERRGKILSWKHLLLSRKCRESVKNRQDMFWEHQLATG